MDRPPPPAKRGNDDPQADPSASRDRDGDGDAGDAHPPEVLVELVARRHREELVHHARLKLGPLKASAEDLVHDVFSELLDGKLDAARIGKGKELGFIKRVISYRALHVLRDSRSPVELDRSLSRSRAGAWSQAWRLEARRRLGRGLRRLPKKQRRALVWRHLQGRSTAEIAELEGVPKATVRQRISRGRRRLAQDLESPNRL